MWPKHCANPVCGQDMWPWVRRSAARKDGRVHHESRGLCTSCYRFLHRRGLHIIFPVGPRRMTNDEVMAEWDWMRPLGYTKREAAAQLGMTFEAFDRAFHRARTAGDARAYLLGEKRVAA